jgi:phytoene synthase
VDQTADAAVGLEVLHQRLDRVYQGRPFDSPVDRAFTAVVEGFEIPRQLPQALLEGFHWDVDGRQYETISDVRSYATRVAATVGVMMTLLMGRRSHEALWRATDLGVAMQLTNIARDVGEDARAGRLYLPRQWMAEAGLEPTRWLADPNYTPALGQVVRRLLDEADRLYERADAGIPLLPRDCQAGIGAARLIYADIGRSIRLAQYDSVRHRAVTSTWRKLRFLLRALGRPWGGGGTPAPLGQPLDEALPIWGGS